MLSDLNFHCLFGLFELSRDMQNKIDRFCEIYEYFQTPQERYMKQEEAIAFICWFVRQHDSYGTELISYVKMKLSGWNLSDTILYAALSFLEKNGMIARYSKGVDGRGRPRNMIKIPDDLPEAKRKHVDKLAGIWQSQCLRIV